jgi:hypothetical protein
LSCWVGLREISSSGMAGMVLFEQQLVMFEQQEWRYSRDITSSYIAIGQLNINAVDLFIFAQTCYFQIG